MKQKIKEALQQGHKNLGLNDEVFERVATSVETFITDEADIDKYVNSELVKSLLRFEQADADRKRAKREGEKQKPTNNGDNPVAEPPVSNEPTQQIDMAKIIADAVAQAIQPISEELAQFKAEKAVGDTISTVNSRIDAWGYGKGYPKEMEKARRNAMELYEAYGKKWTADELEAKIKEKFNQEVYDKGIDTNEPFKGDDSAKSDNNLDTSEITRALQARGNLPKSE